MKLAAIVAVAALISLFSFSTAAETVTLANGDRITGKISDSDGKTLTLTTDYAGDVKIKWASIKDLVADKPLIVSTSDKKTISGTVTLNHKQRGRWRRHSQCRPRLHQVQPQLQA